MAQLSTKAEHAPAMVRRTRHGHDVRAAGNQAAQRLLRSSAIRAKLIIDGPGERFEHEADRLAEEIMSSPHDATTPCCSPCASTSTNSTARPGARELGPTPGAGRPLPPSTRAFFEPRLGFALGDIRVHTDQRSARTAREIGARAFTSGRDIVFDRGEYAPESPSGRRLIAHELAHVAQQRRSDSMPSVQRQKTSGELNWEQMRHSGPVEWKPGMRAVVLQDRTGPTGSVKRGTLVEVVANPGFGMIQVQPVDPKMRTADPLQVHDIRLDPVGPFAVAGQARTVGTQPQLQTVFKIQTLDAASAHALDIDPSMLPEGTMVPLEVARQQAYPGIGFGWAGAPWPAFSLPANATGVQWTQSKFGHFSQFSNVPGAPTIGGYRSWIPLHGIQGLYGAATGQPWTRPILGRYWNDSPFRWMFGADRQTMVYRQNSPAGAQWVADVISRGRYTEPYTFPPVAPGTSCTNCITAPQAEVYAALGGRPVIVTPDGQVVDITEMGRGRSPSEPFTIEQAGRGTTMREWLADPKVQTPTGQIEPLNVTRPPSSNVWGSRGVFVVRTSGRVLLIYGAYNTYERLDEAAGTPEFNRVLAQETGSWVGGLIGGAIGTAAAAALLCAPSGPGALVCAAGGFVLGLAGGALGSMAGALGGDYVYEQASQAMETAGEVFSPMIERAIWGDVPIPGVYYPSRQFGENEFEYEEERERYMRSQSRSGSQSGPPSGQMPF